MENDCRTEVIDLHRFFETWLTGSLDRTQDEFARLSEVLWADFEMISPSGTRTARKDLLSSVWDAHGVHRDRSFSIRIDNLACRPLADAICLATYHERQAIDGEETGRLSSAVFIRNETAPNGVVWAHVHEVWLPT